MNEAAGVRFVEPDGHVRQHPDEALGGQHLLTLQDVTKLLAVEKLHRERPRSELLVVLEIEHLDDVLVREERADLVLALEALERDVVLDDVIVQHLDGDARVRLLVDRLVDPAHAAVGHAPPYFVPTAKAHADARVVVRRGDRSHAGGCEGRPVCRAKAGIVREDALTLRAAFHAGTRPIDTTMKLPRPFDPAKPRWGPASRRTPVQPRSGATGAIAGAGGAK